MGIGQAIREARIAAGWTRTQVAAAAGATEAAARKWENGAVPSGDYVERLRRALPGLAKLLDDKAVA